MKYFQYIFRLALCFPVLLVLGCLTDSRNAKTTSVFAEGKKDHVLIFTGSDWSDEAHTFVEQVMTKEFFSALDSAYTIHHIDLPRVASEAEQTAVRKNYLLFSEYEVTDIPFIVLQTAANDVYAASALSGDYINRSKVIKKIRELRSETGLREAIVKARKLIEGTEGVIKAEAIDAFLAIVLYADAPRYDSLRLQVPQLDPENRSGLRGKYLLMSADIRAKMQIRKGNVIGASDEYRAAAQLPELSDAERQIAWFWAAYMSINAETSDNATAIDYLKNGIAADPHGESVAVMEQMIKDLKK